MHTKRCGTGPAPRSSIACLRIRPCARSPTPYARRVPATRRAHDRQCRRPGHPPGRYHARPRGAARHVRGGLRLRPHRRTPGVRRPLDQVVSRGSLRCGIPIGGLPVAAKDASGAIVGSVPDLCTEMAKSLGVKLDIVDTPTPDRIPFIQTNKIDVTIGTITLEPAPPTLLEMSYASRDVSCRSRTATSPSTYRAA
jgi:hypothetical protein